MGVGGEEYASIAPLDALAILMGEGKNIRYRKPGVMDAVVGIALPPAIFVYGHREMSVGRRYRSLFKHSIFEATDRGAIVPIIMDPGAEISGFLFFYPPPDVNPYVTGEDAGAVVDTALASELRLTVTPKIGSTPCRRRCRPAWMLSWEILPAILTARRSPPPMAGSPILARFG